MRRIASTPRENWRARLDEIGFSFYDLPSEGGRPYWNESAAYVFRPEEITELEAATAELFARCMDAVEVVVRAGRFAEFGIPAPFHDLVRRSWDDDDPTVYGRFDLAYDGSRPPVMLEFNADTPTSLVESAAAQWQWLVETQGPHGDQFNDLHDLLIEQWQHIRVERWGLAPGARLHLASLRDTGDGELIVEDFDTVAYMAEPAAAAGFDPKLIFMEDVRWSVDDGRFVDGDGEPIRHIFKLYPWEWMLAEQFGGFLERSRGDTAWVEPAWKLLLSNKQLLVVLWELFPGHPNLLPAYETDEPFVGVGGGRGRAYVKKPRLGREGANVTVFEESGAAIATADGSYGEEGFVYQARAEVGRIGGKSVVIGSWVVGETPAGIDIRETSTLITGDLAEFVPHLIDQVEDAIEAAEPETTGAAPTRAAPTGAAPTDAAPTGAAPTDTETTDSSKTEGRS